MRPDLIFNRLQNLYGMLPQTLLALSLPRESVYCIEDSPRDERYSSPSRADEMNTLQGGDSPSSAVLKAHIMSNGRIPLRLELRSIEPSTCFYVYNLSTRMFLNCNEQFVEICKVNEDCAFDSLKAAHCALSKYSDSEFILKTFVIYEQVRVSYLNEHAVSATMIEQKTDKMNVVSPETSLNVCFSMLLDLINSRFVSDETLTQLQSEKEYIILNNMPVEVMCSLSKEYAQKMIDYIMQIKVKPPSTVTQNMHGTKPNEYVTFKEYLHWNS